MTGSETIQILMAVFNGERFLGEQLDSIMGQTWSGWQLCIRDDGSTDGTSTIIQEYLRRDPERIRQLETGGKNRGPCGNFAELLEASDAPYVMFSDQDDVWLPDKVAVTMAAMAELESRHGRDMPLLVHTDLKVVDEDLAPLGESFWRYQGSDPDRLTTLNRVLLQNFATGCTVMVNRALVTLARPVPSEARMHDWWLALVATVFGRVAAISRPTVLYRQHGRNDTGAVNWNFWREAAGMFDRERRRRAVERRDEIFTGLERQAAAFLERFHDRLNDHDRMLLELFATLRRRNFIMRRYLTVRHGFVYSNRLMTLGMLAFR